MTTQGTESTPTTPPPSSPGYALRFDVKYQEEARDKVTVALRIFMVIPIYAVLASITGWSFGWSNWGWGNSTNWQVAIGGGTGVLFVAPALMIIFRQKYPRWWFDFSVNLLKFQNRVGAYVCLMRDEYPSTDEEQAVKLEADYPDASQLNRWLPIVKWLLVIPHLIVLWILGIGAFVAVIVAWFSILITGEYPRGLFNFVVGVMRWYNRVIAYAFLLNTDVYPPFSLE